jgi:hypothetical protein
LSQIFIEKMSLVAILAIVIFLAGASLVWSRSTAAEPFVANCFQEPVYLNNEGVIPRTNDIRDQLYDFHNQYNDTHSWLWTDLLPGDRAVNCSRGYSPENGFTGPDLDRNNRHFYNHRDGLPDPKKEDLGLLPTQEREVPARQPDTGPNGDGNGSRDGRKNSRLQESSNALKRGSQPLNNWDDQPQSEANPRFDYRRDIYDRLPLWNDIRNVKKPEDVPHRVMARRSRSKDQQGGSPYNPNLLSEPAEIWEPKRRGRTSSVTYKNDIKSGQELPPDLVEKIRLVQPHFFNQVEITQREDGAYYHDARYPRDLVPVGFIENPRSFSFDHLDAYPGYRFYSKF